jgi:hypothetical protein
MKTKHLFAGLLLALCAVQVHAVEYRYVRVTSITGYSGSDYTGPYTTCGELRLSDGGSPISPSGHSVTASDYFEGGGEPDLVLDSNTATTWHTEFDPSDVPQPHWIVYDAGSPIEFDRVLWTNRGSGNNGGLGQYEVHGSDNGSDWTLIGSGTAQTGAPINDAVLELLVSDPSSGSIGAGLLDGKTLSPMRLVR